MTQLSKMQMFKFIVIGMLTMGFLCIVISLSISSSSEHRSKQIPTEQLLQQYWSEQSMNMHKVDPVNELQATTNNAESVTPSQQERLEATEEQNIAITTDQVVANNQAETTDHGASSTDKIDINMATVEQLVQLKGIGPSKAKAIVEERELRGQFRNINDIKRVKGIGEKLFDGIKESIVVNP